MAPVTISTTKFDSETTQTGIETINYEINFAAGDYYKNVPAITLSDSIINDQNVVLADGSTFDVYFDDDCMLNIGDVFTLLKAYEGIDNLSTYIVGEVRQGEQLFELGVDYETIVSNNSLQIIFISAVPEPSTYAMIFGALALGLAMYRRRK